MQTWCYGSIRWGEEKLSHVLLRKDSKIVAAAQAVIFKAPKLPIGVAYVRWGPCWQVNGQPKDLEIFRRMLQALYHIYVVQRGLLLQVYPKAVENGHGILRPILEEEGFQRDPYGGPTRTLVMDLSHPLQELRRSLKRKWRHNLVLAERNNLTITSGVDDRIFQDLMALQTELKARKKWESIADRRYLTRVQRSLPTPFKMMCLVCRHNGEPASGVAVSTAGNTALLLLAPTGNKGLKLRSSYLLQWRLVEWLKSTNVRWYDLCYVSCNPNTGHDQFKSGLAGKLGLELDYVGAYQAGNYPLARFSVQAVERSRNALFNLKHTLGLLVNG